eukprot:TRINITY_DN13184_c0_g1_i2.p2 TRINITY_DN13184_c0_g1~~TRINITY_DN13184_c0_g1_i2.p2  ORF type:complete len:178 (-),score=57.11 TRINITY_DN13184_c0_g1_i2:53-586(-)
MHKIGMSRIYEKVVHEDPEQHPLIRMADQLILEMRNKSAYCSERKRCKSRGKSGGELSCTARNVVRCGIYERSMAQLSERKFKREKLKQEAEEREMEGVTFMPELNERSRTIFRNISRLLIETDSRAASKEVLDRQVYTFRPAINSVYATRSVSQDRFNELYEDSSCLLYTSPSPRD